MIGVHEHTTGAGYGVRGETASSDGHGVHGYASATSGANRGVYGQTDSYDGHAGYFDNTASGNYGALGGDDYGVQGRGDIAGGYFETSYGSGYAKVGHGNCGIWGYGSYAGGYFEDLTDGTWSYVASGDSKILSNGICDFVQNHPEDPEAVIVYACPEGAEVATYTRGTARLHNGVARVPLGETFKWVTNPDIGLTAHLTPRGNCDGLYVEVLGTNEMIVRELRGGTSNVTFDYIVYGLRIGFEEVSIVQEKKQEAYIPSMASHRALYERRPELRDFNAIERFKRMRAAVGQTELLDMSPSQALHDAIVEFDPAVHSLDHRPELEAPEPIEAGEDPPREQHPYRPGLVGPNDPELAQLRARVVALEALVARLAAPQNGGEQ